MDRGGQARRLGLAGNQVHRRGLSGRRDRRGGISGAVLGTTHLQRCRDLEQDCRQRGREGCPKSRRPPAPYPRRDLRRCTRAEPLCAERRGRGLAEIRIQIVLGFFFFVFCVCCVFVFFFVCGVVCCFFFFFFF